MAQANNTLFKLLLVLSLLLMISTTESIRFGFGNQDSSPVCNSVHGADSGETCSTVAQEFGLSLQDFLNINPNINCDAIFVGQWVCVDGST
ncbi:hypothetical protein C2S53_012240 [Perilla frutescens var. hirtella]|uniref:LysM domain-containing protein n=1 Tax=Perilla frutescens var. hirtella TaxID=608512 RepID=A0AAD4J3H1_PERFH|nr:hypothetical protein C2S53_012240 [Perilla frutescens var. hirtella]